MKQQTVQQTAAAAAAVGKTNFPSLPTSRELKKMPKIFGVTSSVVAINKQVTYSPAPFLPACLSACAKRFAYYARENCTKL